MTSHGPWSPSELQTHLLRAWAAEDDAWAGWWQAWRGIAGPGRPDATSIRLLPLVYWRAGSTSMDDPQMQLARSVYLQTLAQNLRREERLGGILRLFADQQIDTMLIKGAASSAAFYPSRGLRDMGDVDLLVPFDAAGRAAELLIAGGWQPSLGATVSEILRERRVRHAWPFTLDSEHEIDLHWHPVAYCFNPDVVASFRRHARRARVAGIEVSVPSPTEQLFHICAHAIQLAWVPTIRWIADAISVLRTAGADVDWRRMIDLARAAQMTVRLRTALNWLASELDLPIPTRVLEDLRAQETRWEIREAALHTKTPPLAHWDYARWHWWNFVRLQPFDAAWSRLPPSAGFAVYLHAWMRAHRADRYARFRRLRG